MPRKMPKNVHKQRTRHGAEVYYFRRGQGPRLRLPDISSPKFSLFYNQAAEGRPLDVRDIVPSPVKLRKQRVEKAIVACLCNARNRSRRKSIPFDLTIEWLLETVQRQDFRCQLTGIEFYAKSGTRGKINPFAPSLDRIIPSKGYTKDHRPGSKHHASRLGTGRFRIRGQILSLLAKNKCGRLYSLTFNADALT